MNPGRPPYTSTRIWTCTVRTLRELHALAGESIVRILNRLAEAELARLQQQEREQQEGDRGDRAQGL